ncbi:MAG: aminoglycoside phosphotransferase [Rhizobiales bacterium]|nr:aminoglycoside phosphotransferase [Hyphomicrobiales bacterium]MBA69841.1 aminoglycoside phosphotransferase [Hyphomicrobiales bacterium]|tara:strand:+ start:71 stop:1594 length:1524 start_codon:yes stop_codon:yes gene_type:complete
MIVDKQHETIGFLERADSYGCAQAVEGLETHISRIFLAGDRAYKLKRAVDLPYVDFSTPAKRLAACEKEISLNGRAAPSLYLGVRRITRDSDGRLAFDGPGEMVDAVVEMKRFGQDALFDRIATEGGLDADLMERTAAMIARFHDQAEIDPDAVGDDNIAGVLSINEAGFETSQVFEKDEAARFSALFRERLERIAPHLNRRATDGKIRRCHGDLHLRNICLIDGEPVLFDCIEFNDAIATIDVLYDLAFLLMDLWHRDLQGYANLVANRYLDLTGDETGLVLLPFFMALRAAVRAHVTATQAEEAGEGEGKLVDEARSYFDLARAILEEKPAMLVAMGGYSGSGKSTVADRVAPSVGAPPGARALETDRMRKSLYHVPPETRLGPEAYTQAASDRVYDAVDRHARAVLTAGGPVVVNAVFSREAERQAIAQVADAAGVRFAGFWLEAPADVLRARVAARDRGPSDADEAVLAAQIRRGAGEIGWPRIDCTPPPDEVALTIVAKLDS